ncbi:MAG TPA: Flp family type IVb pilin [Caulobacteraceae bacterium]|nr:Flp family type IVb pilin [Caulobacteraceae bacterium]
MVRFFQRFLKDRSGATAIEYGLIAVLIAVALISGASAIGSALNGEFSSIGNDVTTGS